MTWAFEYANDVLEAIEGATPTPGGWYRVPCPVCRDRGGHNDTKKKLSVNADNGYYQCFRADCGIRGFTLLSERHLVKGKRQEEKSDGKVPLPEEYFPLDVANKTSSLSLRPYFSYLEGRGITDRIIQGAHIGVCFRGRYAAKVIVPVHQGGQVVGFTSRSIADKVYMNPPGFMRTKFMLNGDALLEETDCPVVIVEGPFDCLRHWPHAVACFGKPTSHHIALIRQAKRPVVIGLDADAQMEGWGLAMTLELSGQNIRWMGLRPGTDPGKTPHDEFMAWALSAPKPSAIDPDRYRA